MKTLLSFFLLLISTLLVAQKINIENENVIRYFKKGTGYNCTYENELYKFLITKIDTINYKFILINNKDTVEQTFIREIDNSRIVNNTVRILLIDLTKINNKPYSEDCIATLGNSLYRKIIDDIFSLNIVNNLASTNENNINVGSILFKAKKGVVKYSQQPLTSSKLLWFIKKNIKVPEITGEIKVDKIEIAFEDGIIKDMILKGKLNGDNIQFKNFKSFSVRNPYNINRFNSNHYSLFSDYNGKRLTIKLSDLIFYDRNIVSGSGTYIPKNDTVILNNQVTNVKLYKDNYVNNFDIRLFSDVTGLNKNNSNGILQFDGKIDFILSTESMFHNKLFSKGVFSSFMSENSFIVFNRISPYILFSKIEGNQKSLPLTTFVNDSLLENSYNYSTSFNFFKYSNLNLGINLNLFTLLTQSKKIRLNLSGGLFRTLIDSTLSISKSNLNYLVKTISNPKNLISWYLMPELEILFIESDRIEFETKYGFIASKLVDNEIKQIKTNSKNILENEDFKFYDLLNWIHKIQASINIHPNPKNKESSVFMRSIYYWNKNDNNLSLQFGYATSITNLFNQFKTSNNTLPNK